MTVKPDDSSLSASEYATVSSTARHLLDRAGAWGVYPTPVADLMATADLKVAPISAFDEHAMLRYIRKGGDMAGRLLRLAIEKVRGILDVHAATVHVDDTVNEEKQRFLKLHETAHFELPHQRGLFRWVQDCDRSLSPEISELFEREANTFARIVLFQDDAFAKIALDDPFSIKVPLKVGRKFGASVYASMREYVRRHHKACAVIVFEPLEMAPGIGIISKVRRAEVSDLYLSRFGRIALPTFITSSDMYMKFFPHGTQRMSSPRTFESTDINGNRSEFVGEGFKTSHNVFVLIHERASLKSVISLP